MYDMELTINPNRIELDEAYMRMAEIWAQRSKANRKQVGALIVKDKQIISDGYNGMPAGERDDTCEFWHFDPNDERSAGSSVTPTLRTKPEVLHAESNAIAKLAENGGVGGQGATLYVTMSPCKECAKLIKQTKIKRVVFREQYRDGGGIEFLTTRGVEVLHLPGTGLTQSQPLQSKPPAPPLPPPTIDLPPPLPPIHPTASASEDEVLALLRAHESSQLAASTLAAGGPAASPPEAPYKSSFA